MAESSNTPANTAPIGGNAKSFGQDLADQLFRALYDLEQLPLDGARDLPVLEGLTRNGGFEDLQENVLSRMIELLRESGRVYLYGANIMFETERLQGDGNWLVALRSGIFVESRAEDWLSNVMVCEHKGKQFPPPRWLVQLVLTAETLRPELPRIEVYSLRPIFDDEFILRGPGWHPGPGILVHGPAIEPAVLPSPPPDGPALDRLPPHLRTLLQGFCFRGDADVVNTVAMLVTGLLVHHFVRAGKPIWLVDGNQPNTGKSWLVRTLGMVLDGSETPTLFYTADDEELQKRICAKLRETASSVLLIDNAKMVGGGAVSSPVIESLSVAPEISLRILGVSANYSRPNDLLWTITMNDTRTSPDLVSRGVPVQLYYEGRPEDRVFTGPNPIDFARENRLAILGELAGMIIRWNQQGRPEGATPHRLQNWARVVGGILAVANLPEFLANAQDAAAEFNSASDELAALAEAVITGGGPFVVADTEDDQ